MVTGIMFWKNPFFRVMDLNFRGVLTSKFYGSRDLGTRESGGADSDDPMR